MNQATDPGSKYWQPTALALAAVFVAAGCATTATDPRDPLEGLNRAVFSFNEGVDKVAIKPLAQGYEFVVPLPGRTVITNFFANLQDPWIAVNNLLQGKVEQALSDAGRFIINSSAGILGAFDIASELGLQKHDEDFGQTVGHYGVGPGPYLVLPFFGPRDVRDALTLIVDGYADPVYYLVDDVPTRNILYGVRQVSNRASVLSLDKIIEEAALDKYAYIREAYLQRRRNLIFDGKPPREKDEDAANGSGEGMAQEPHPADAVSEVGVESRGAVAAGVPPIPAPTFNDTAPVRVKSQAAADGAAGAAAEIASGTGAE